MKLSIRLVLSNQWYILVQYTCEAKWSDKVTRCLLKASLYKQQIRVRSISRLDSSEPKKRLRANFQLRVQINHPLNFPRPTFANKINHY